MRGLVIWNTYAQPLIIKRLGIVDLRLADSNKIKVKIEAIFILKNRKSDAI